MSEHKINSMDYWDNRFQTNWENFLGREQTEFFINLLLENLPKWFLSELEEKTYSICDAGCAEGDGTKILSQKFTKSNVLGIDFSIEAVNKAKKYYPDVNFDQGDIMNLSRQFDIIICSNVLEHFSNPMDIIPMLIEKTEKHVVIMVPFLENERIKEHLFTFDYTSFPLEIKNYNLTYFTEIDGKLIDKTHWYGKQAIVIYSNKEILNNNVLDLAAFNNNTDKNYYEKVYFEQIEQINKIKEQLEIKEQDRQWYRNQFEIKNQDIQWYQSQIEKNNEVVSDLTNSISEKTVLINHFMREVEEKNYKITQFEYELLNANQQLISMQKTKGWRILNRYYRIANSIRGIKGNTKKFFYISKTKGIKEAIKRSFTYLNKNELLEVVNNSKLIELYIDILNKYKNGFVKGIAIIPSAFEFDELYNQRTINLAKYLAKENYAVIYVVWQWNKNELLEKSYECFLDKVYQVPLFDFLETQFDLINEIKDKKFFITFPAEEFYNLIVSFRENAFHITYDIMDEWEEFYNTGEAPWYKKEIEEAIVLNSDLVVSVSDPLKEKFGFLRNDILVIGNGYDEKVSVIKNISLKVEASDKKIHIGYFGHLTASWFDWDLVFGLANKEQYFIHLIGYGANEKILNKINEYNNIKFYGKVHPSELHNYVEKWHLGIIPFKQSKLSIAVDPIKIYEYLFFGLPTISTGIPHIGKYPMVTHCENIIEVDHALKDSYKKLFEQKLEKSLIEQFLKDTTWNSRFDLLINNVIDKSLYQNFYS